MRVLFCVLFVSGFSVSVISNINTSSRFADYEIETEGLAPIATVEQGKLRGLWGYSRKGRKFAQFLGIQYGKAERFQLPQQPDSWSDIKNATNFGNICVQYDFKNQKGVGDDDCLYLNVYVPTVINESSSGNLPVMLYIHGGSFVEGNGSMYGAKYFMDEDIILITINYRLGPFGFLNTGTKDASGNMGLKDQIFALKWVKRNIDRFGGNSNSVTIFGESAGGASVSYLILSPMSKGLFHQAISHSGTSLCWYAFNRHPIEEAMKLGKLLDCPTRNLKDMVECLRKANSKDIIEKSKYNYFDMWDDTIPKFSPSVEYLSSDLNNSDIFLPAPPYTLYKDGKFNKVPWITGATSYESLGGAMEILKNATLTKQFNEEWNNVAPTWYSFKHTNVDQASTSHKIRDFYFHGNTIDKHVVKNLTDSCSDRMMLQCVKTAAFLHSKFSPVYLYYFSLWGPASVTNTSGFDFELYSQSPAEEDPLSTPQELKPPGHFDDLQYIFNISEFPEINTTSTFFNFSDAMVSQWVSFAISGKPTDVWGEEWAAIDSTEYASPRWYNIDKVNKNVPEEQILQSRIVFWDKILPLEDKMYTKYSDDYHQHHTDKQEL